MSFATPQELAGHIGVHINTIYSMAQRGDIPVAFRVGPRIRFDVDAVMQALKDREDQSCAK